MDASEFGDREALMAYLWERRNWERWAAAPELGTLNLVSAAKRAEAAALVRVGDVLSLSLPISTRPSKRNPEPLHQRGRRIRPSADMQGIADYIGIDYHGYSVTHIDALCHVWTDHGMWGGHDPEVVLSTELERRLGGVDAWSAGIVTRGILVDIPRLRDVPWVDLDSPVTAGELEAACDSVGLKVDTGDALAIYMGRDAWEAEHPGWSGYSDPRPGLDASCLRFFRDHDLAAVIWDFSDARPNRYQMHWTVHLAIPYFGLAVIDNASLGALASRCQLLLRHEFLLLVAPLVVAGGAGSPVNPLVVF